MFPVLLLLLFIIIATRNYHVIPFLVVVFIALFTPIVVLDRFSIIRLVFIFVIFFGFVNRKKAFDYTPIDKLILFASLYSFISAVFVSFLASTLTFGEQFSSIKGVVYELLVFYVIWRLKNTLSDFYKYNKYICYLIFVLCIYGIFEYISNQHPYLKLINDYSSVDLIARAERSIQDARGALSGRITGVAPYTIQYGALMMFLILYTLSTCINNLTKVSFIVVIVLLLSNLYLTGSRGPIVSLFVPALFYYARTMSWRIKVFGIFVFIVFLYFLNEIGAFELANDDVDGSSIDGRLEQFEQSIYFMLIGGGALWGHGLGYANSLIKETASGKLIGEFEGVLLYGLVDYGIMGLFLVFFVRIFLYYYIAYKAYRTNMITYNNFLFLSMILSVYVMNALIVGEAYSNLFFIVFLMSLKYFYYFKKRKMVLQSK